MEKKRIWSVFAVLFLCGVLAGAAFAVPKKEEGYHDYTVQKKQYYVEYSDEYPYWDVLTVEYPELIGAEEEPIGQQEQINEILFEAAMDRVNYWHLQPDEEVKRIQESYHLFASDVQCDVPYHSRYLLSVCYSEVYSPIYPVWYVFTTQRGLVADLLTGESYALSDVLRLDKDFVDLWIEKMNEENGEGFLEAEDADILLGWFTCSDEEIAKDYEFAPFFYLTADGEFAIGITLHPKVSALAGYGTDHSTFCTRLEADELTPYRTESLFWERYDEAGNAGEVLECEEKQENIWVGEQGGATRYWEEK